MTSPHVFRVIDAIESGHKKLREMMEHHELSQTQAYDGIRVLRNAGMLVSRQRATGQPATYHLTEPVAVVRRALMDDDPHAPLPGWNAAVLDACWPASIAR